MLFWSRQCEHQKALYILAPDLRRWSARRSARGELSVVISTGVYGCVEERIKGRTGVRGAAANR